MRKWFVVLLVLCGLTVPFVVAIAQQTATQQKPLVVWMKKGFVEKQNSEFIDRVQAFAHMKGIKVNVEMIAYEDFFPRWTAAIESGNVPDVSFFGYQEVGQFYNQGVLADVTKLLDEIQAKYGDIFNNSIEAVTFKGTSYAVPLWGEGTALYYRKDYLKQAGIANPPNTWDEFRKDAIKMTDPKKGVYGAGLGYGQGNSDAEWLSRSILWAFGGAIFDQNGKLALDSYSAQCAVNFIKQLFKQDKVTPPTAMGWNDGGNNTAYISGQAAMVVNTGSIIKALRDKYPDLLAKTGVVVLPEGPAGRFTAGISNNLGVFKGAPHPQLARELIMYLLDPAWYANWIAVSAPLALPVYKNLANSPTWQDEHNKAFMDSMATFRFLGYKGSYTAWAGAIYNARLINTMFADVITNNVSVEKAISNFITEAQTLNK